MTPLNGLPLNTRPHAMNTHDLTATVTVEDVWNAEDAQAFDCLGFQMPIGGLERVFAPGRPRPSSP